MASVEPGKEMIQSLRRRRRFDRCYVEFEGQTSSKVRTVRRVIDISVMCAVFKMSQMLNHSKFIFKKGRIRFSCDLPSGV